ncbi:MAG: hypothetical protein GOVbin703_137 [Prokaryotic dsDNA virus sp.]|nr:MAG: hypothetical protein GOVbin703_137 [Prokaryotic dsDNA virus sp.]|tara:strand:+ start:140 stop:304 length:165 start_codon:yes stop_codon:yes gene_type:complete
MKKIKFRPWGASKESAQEGYLVSETDAKFIVTTGRVGIEMHFPKSMYQFEYVDE